jgi:tellurium resistance protein TerD
MAINLEKGNKINLEKQSSTKLKKVRVGLGWDTSEAIGDCDLDVSVFGCAYNTAGDPKLIDEDYLVFFNNLTCPGGSIQHSGDSLTGSADGDDETIYLDLEKIPTEIDELPIIVTIFQATARGHEFGQIKNAYIKLYNDETNEELAVYHLTTDYAGFISLQFGSMYKDTDHDNAWTFQAIGVGYNIELGDFIKEYTS